MFAVIDGVVHDTACDTDRRRIRAAWRFEDENQPEPKPEAPVFREEPRQSWSYCKNGYAAEFKLTRLRELPTNQRGYASLKELGYLI